MNINLHIERLILEGIDLAPDQRHLLQTRLTTKLTELLSHGGLSSRLAEGTTLARISADSIQSDNKATGLGQQIAQSVYGGIGNE